MQALPGTPTFWFFPSNVYITVGDLKSFQNEYNCEHNLICCYKISSLTKFSTYTFKIHLL